MCLRLRDGRGTGLIPAEILMKIKNIHVRLGANPVFLETICSRSILDISVQVSLYRENNNELRLGSVNLLYSGLPGEDLQSYRDTHIELIRRYAADDLAKQIGKRVKGLRKTEKNIERQLQKFIDMERLPGLCELCQ